MKTGNTSVLEFASRARSRGCRAVAVVATVATIAFGLNVGAHAQGTQTTALARLIVPVTGTIATATPTSATTPTTPTTSTETPTTSTAPSTTPTVTGQAVAAVATPDVTGSFSIRRFARTTDDGVAAVGTLTISVMDPTTNSARTIVTELAMPMTSAGGSAAAANALDASLQLTALRPRTFASTQTSQCGTLSLVLGPLELDVLGNAVQLNEANVDVIAMPEAGESLRNRVCAVTALIDGAAPSTEIVRMLNRLLETMG